MTKDNYECIKCGISPAITYIEGDDREEYWVDFQNAEYYIYQDVDEKTNLIDGKKWWFLTEYKLKGVELTNENEDDIVKWFVFDSYSCSDVNLEWDFEKHEPIKEEK